jgi:class 3 adenylate cyclase/predicted ATPase
LDVGQWLRDLGLRSYEQAFRDNNVDLEILPRLTPEDLREIGVLAVGDRRKILDAISKLGTSEPAAEGSLDLRPNQAERRRLTVMFCDLVGSTAISSRLDPEDMRELLRVYQECVRDVVSNHGGYVAKYLGDGALIYFGYPRADEYDAERAVRAGLELVDAVSRLTAVGERLEARIGLATGLVVVGDLLGVGESQERAVAGETPNLAARLQSLAEGGAVVIADATRRLLGELFEVTAIPPVMLKGFDRPVIAWRVVGESRGQSRFEALHGSNIAPIVGRDEELDLILSRWRQAKEGSGQVALIVGEPGIGKSRLTLALRERLGDEPSSVLSFACSPHHAGSALFPFISRLENECGITQADNSEVRLSKLESLLGGASKSPNGPVALFADLLGVPVSSPHSLTDMSPLQKKGLLFRAFLDRLDRLTTAGPIFIILEDAHWLDPTSKELFDQIVDRVRSLPAFLLATVRPDFAPPWIGFPHVTLLTLNRLAQAHTRALIDGVTGGRSLPPEVIEQILARTEGVPLFTEELAKAIVESGLLNDAGDHYVLDGPLPPLAIPETLHDSLMARLDRLSTVKEVAQIGACIGREFDHELLAAVVPLTSDELASALERLVLAGLIFRRGVPPTTAYIFKHALVRDAAYESLLKSRRQELHENIAVALEQSFPRNAHAQPELVAHHFNEAGIFDRAADFWFRAGQRAAARYANIEAISHLRSGLACVATLPPDRDRSRRELSLQLALGGPVLTTRGFASRETEAAYQRAEELSRELGDDIGVFTALRGLVYVYHVRANFREAEELVDELIELSQRIAGATEEFWTKFLLAGLKFHVGAFEEAEKGFQLWRNYPHRLRTEKYGIDLDVFSRSYSSHCEWHLGFPDRAIQAAKESLSLARETEQPFSTALTLNYLAMLHQFRREPQEAQRAASEARKLCAEHRFDYYGAWSALMEAWAIAETGSLEEGLIAFEVALDEFKGTGAAVRMPYYLCVYAALHRKSGKQIAGLRLTNEAAQIALAHNETWCDAEIERERGELLLGGSSSDAVEEAEAAFRRAIAISRAQGAKMLELRAATSLAKVLAIGGDRERALGELSPIYASILEGYDTLDLGEAKQLISKLQN